MYPIYSSRRSAMSVLACLVTLPGSVAAQQSTQQDSSIQERPVLIAPTIITATREAQRQTESSANISVMSGSEIQESRPAHPAAVMNRMAGVHVTALSGEGHSTAIRQPITTKPMYLYLEDGVPTRATGFFNHNALYEVNVPQSGGIEVMKGPGTALYGSDAIGGIINVLTQSPPAKPMLGLTLEGGTESYRRVLVTGGFRTQSHGVRADLNVVDSDGWRDATRFSRRSGTIRWDYATPTGFIAKTIITATSVDQNDALASPKALFEVRSPANLSPVAFRKVKAVRVSSALEKDNGVTLWSITPYARYNELKLLPFWQLSYNPEVWDTRNTSLGALAKVRYNFHALRLKVIGGTDIDYSPGRHTSDGLFVDAEGSPRAYLGYTVTSPHYNYDVTYHSLSPYLHAEYAPVSGLRIDGGIRYDAVGYTYATKLASVDTGMLRVPASQSVAYRHWSPKLGMTYDVTADMNVYASYRHGFRAPSHSQLFQQGSAYNTVDLKPVQANSFEVGVRGMLHERVGYVVSAYDMRITNDILTYETASNTREATNAGRTSHRGIETSASIMITRDLRIDAAYSVSRQRYVSWDPVTEISYGGHRMEAAPASLGNVFAGYTPAFLHGGRIALEFVSVGRYAMDPQNTHFYNGYQLLNAQASYSVRPGIELFARGMNLTNKIYAVSASYSAFQGEQYTPGTPRMVYGGMRLVVQR